MDSLKNQILNEIFSLYSFSLKQYVGYKVISKGHINTTFVLYFDYGNKVKRFLLQEINTNVFKEPELLMKNINKVTSYALKTLKHKYKNYKNKTLRIYKSIDKQNYVTLKDNSCWRVYHYIENSVSKDSVDNEEIIYQAGKVIGEFFNTFKRFKAKNLFEVIKDFHNTPKRYDDFIKSVNDSNLSFSCKEEINFFIDNKYICSLITDLLKDNKIPVRVTHNDTKLNNLMFEYKSNKGICLVDLDTIMPGSICYDYGDFIRSACNSANEDEKDLSKVLFLKERCLTFTKGFVGKVKNSITLCEINNLINGAIVMTYECGMRFLKDYLDHNIYFKTSYSNQNLIRAKTQICLCSQIIKNKEELEKEILNIYYMEKAS